MDDAVEDALHATVSTDRFNDFTSETKLCPELQRSEPSNVVRIVKHVTSYSFVLVGAKRNCAENDSLQNDSVWVCVSNRTGDGELSLDTF